MQGNTVNTQAVRDIRVIGGNNPLLLLSFMNKAYLLMGGNIGNREKNLARAITLLNENCGTVVAHSSIYETAAWGNTDQQDFLNQAILLETQLSAEHLMSSLLQVEEIMGRKRNEKFGPRTIDLDILLFNDEVHHTAHIKIPHPELHNRRFALAPLAEIAENRVHPVLKKTIAELLIETTDKLPVKKWGVSY